MKYIDLHVHSNYSDGSFSPRELVDHAMEHDLSAIALTDHDTVDGLDEILSYAASLKESGRQVPQIIPGIEFSTEYHGKDVHILGLYIDYKQKSFLSRLKEFVDSRILRNQKMCRKLREAGIDITYEKLLEAFPDSVITRAHYARYLLDNGYINSLQEAFDRYVGDHCPYFVPREKVTPVQAILLIREAGGIPVLAHPLLYHFSEKVLEELVAECTAAGLDALEALYLTHSPSEERQMIRLAKKYNLLLSGGSDFHGANKPKVEMGCGYGSLKVPETVLDDLKKTRHCLLFSDMDGTLLNSQKCISPATRDAIDQMTAAGHSLVLTSGRALPSIMKVKETQALNYPHMLIIAHNGAQVYDCDSKTNILEHRLEWDDMCFIISEALKRGLYIQAYDEEGLICRKKTEECMYYIEHTLLPVRFADDLPGALDRPSYKLIAIHLTDHERLEQFRRDMLPLLGDRVQILFSNDKYLEFFPVSAGKGNAVRFVERYLHVPHSHTFAAGDAENDISMLQAAGTGVAMQNAEPAVKAAADIITVLDNDHDGLVEVMEKYFR